MTGRIEKENGEIAAGTQYTDPLLRYPPNYGDWTSDCEDVGGLDGE